MTDVEIEVVRRQAAAELNEGEEAMLISPLVVLEIIERLHGCERAREAAGLYDQLH